MTYHSDWSTVRLLFYLLYVIVIVQTRPRNDHDEDVQHNKHDIELNSAIEKSFSWVELFTAVESTPSPASPQTEKTPSPASTKPRVQERDMHAGVVVGRELLGTGAQLHKDICGTRPAQEQSFGTRRIIGGEPAEPGEFPWQVGLIRIPSSRVKEKPVLTCGGALLSTHSVLTACHCLKLPANRYEVSLGRISSAVDEEDCHEQRFHVVEYFKHPKFNPDTLQNDVAVLSIRSKYGQGVWWNDWVLPICLPHPHYHQLYTPGTEGVVTGWGLLEEEDKYMSLNLQHVEVPITSLDYCNEAYTGLTTLLESQVCAGDREGGRDACAGDSGGPLAVKDVSDDRFYLAGLVSFGMGCGRPEYPGVYSRVDYYTPWVLTIVSHIEQVGSVLPTVIQSMHTSSQPTTTTRPTTTTTTRTTTTTVRTTTRSARVFTTMTTPSMHELGPVCQGSKKWAVCSIRGQVIRVISGSYGRPAGSSECAGMLVPWYMRRECSLPSAGVELARACNGKRTCRITTRVGKDDIFSRNPCIRQRPFVTMEFMCEAGRGNTLRSFSEEEEDIHAEEGIEEDEVNRLSDDEKYTNYVRF